MTTLLQAIEVRTQEEADECFSNLVEQQLREHGADPSTVDARVRCALGYFAGYYDHETRLRIEQLYRCEHPIFGPATKGLPSPEKIFRMGLELGSKRRACDSQEPGTWIERGTVLSFNDETKYGYLTLQGQTRQFHSTSFHGGRPARWPIVGESVDVVFNPDGAVVEVRALSSARR